MIKKAILAILFHSALLAGAQSDSMLHVNQFPGITVADKVTNAMPHCPAAPVPCYLVIDASLAAAASGTMPALPANAQLVDFRTSWPGGSQAFFFNLTSPATWGGGFPQGIHSGFNLNYNVTGDTNLYWGADQETNYASTASGTGIGLIGDFAQVYDNGPVNITAGNDGLVGYECDIENNGAGRMDATLCVGGSESNNGTVSSSVTLDTAENSGMQGWHNEYDNYGTVNFVQDLTSLSHVHLHTGSSTSAVVGLHIFGNIINDGVTLPNLYGIYVGSLTAATTNFAVYTAGTTPSKFGGSVESGSLKGDNLSGTGVSCLQADANGNIARSGGACGGGTVDEYLTFTGCSLAASTDNQCSGTFNLTSAMPDASYQVFAQVNNLGGAQNLFLTVNGSLPVSPSTAVPYVLTCTFGCATVVAPTVYVHAHHN